MPKPNWDDAPEWANYLAQDEDGTWFWYSYKPVITNGEYWDARDGNTEPASVEDWEKSLEKRPGSPDSIVGYGMAPRKGCDEPMPERYSELAALSARVDALSAELESRLESRLENCVTRQELESVVREAVLGAMRGFFLRAYNLSR